LQPTHLTCLLKQFKEINGGEPLKNKVDWLNEFIKFSSLTYCCKSCFGKQNKRHTDDTASAAGRDDLLGMEQNITTMKQSIAELDIKISGIVNSIKV
jgi:hypothetical protein